MLLAAAVSLGSGGPAVDAGGLFGDATSIINSASINANDELNTFGLIDSDKQVLFGDNGLQLEQTAVLDQHKRYLDHLAELRRINEGDDASDAPGYSVNLLRLPVSILPGTHTRAGHGAEITFNITMPHREDMLPRLMRDLVINDVVDSLALPMTRFLNSDPQAVYTLLTGFDEQNRGYPRLNHLVVSSPLLTDDTALTADIVRLYADEQLNIALNQHVVLRRDAIAVVGPFDASNIDRFRGELAVFDRLFGKIKAAAVVNLTSAAPVAVVTEGSVELLPPPGNVPGEISMFMAPGGAGEQLRAAASPSAMPIQATGLSALEAVAPSIAEKLKSLPVVGTPAQIQSARAQKVLEVAAVFDAADGRLAAIERTAALLDAVNGIAALSSDLVSQSTGYQSSLTRRSTLPVPPSQLVEVYGMKPIAHLAYAMQVAFRSTTINREIIHLGDVQAFLREEVSAAYTWAERPELADLWGPLDQTAVVTHDVMGLPIVGQPGFGLMMPAGEVVDLATAIRTRDLVAIETHRNSILGRLGSNPAASATATLVWGVHFVSRLINERLVEDMRHHHVLPEHYDEVCAEGSGCQFYGPNPTVECRELFAQYVAARWPLRVFTIDPVVTEQNVADTVSIYRQMQLAAALAVAGGEINGNAAMRFVRELQRDAAAIDVNRTVVGFAHGSDTFGWRFAPRFQTPPVQNNAVVLFRDLIVGGPTDRQLLRTREIEPGMRECTAVVLAPSFIDDLNLESRSNWFCLDKPSHSALSMRETTRLSRSIVQMRRTAESCIRRPDLYRAGETDRLLSRVTQLDRELPLQTLPCPVPASNSLGGFELFSSGTRELGPELLGWYGSPGYDRGGGEQTFFLVGDNFSVHETEAIAGTRGVATHLLSRQILRVTLPPGLPVVPDERLAIAPVRPAGQAATPLDHYDGFVDVHVATPYGISGHLLIPSLKTTPAVAALRPRLQGFDALIRVPVKQGTDKAWVVDPPIVPATGRLFRITVPPSVGLGGAGPTPTATITLLPRIEGEDLPAVVFDNVAGGGGGYDVGLPQLTAQVGTSGSLTKSLGGYVAFDLNRKRITTVGGDTDRLGQPIVVSVNATISVGSGPDVAVQGTATMVVVAVKP